MRSLLQRAMSCISSGVLLCSCAAGGTAFDRPMITPTGQAMVYVYRPADLYGGAWTVHVTDNDNEVATLATGQFRAVPLDVGHHQLSTDVTDGRSVKIDAVAGETYYVRFGMSHGLRVNSAGFTRAYPEDALRELRRCCKSGLDSPEPLGVTPNQMPNQKLNRRP